MPATLTLTITISDEAFTRLTERAATFGQTPEEVAASDVGKVLRESITGPGAEFAEKDEADGRGESLDSPVPWVRLESIRGIIDSPIENVADRVDELIGNALVEQLRGSRGV